MGPDFWILVLTAATYAVGMWWGLPDPRREKRRRDRKVARLIEEMRREPRFPPQR